MVLQFQFVWQRILELDSILNHQNQNYMSNLAEFQLHLPKQFQWNTIYSNSEMNIYIF